MDPELYDWCNLIGTKPRPYVRAALISRSLWFGSYLEHYFFFFGFSVSHVFDYLRGLRCVLFCEFA